MTDAEKTGWEEWLDGLRVNPFVQSDIRYLLNRVIALESALAPFAEFGREYLGHSASQPKDGEVYTVDFTGKGARSITVEALRTAVEAISEKSQNVGT